MKIFRFLLLPALFLSLFIFNLCTKEHFAPYPGVEDAILNNCNLQDVSYEGTILLILQDNCIGCHNSTSPAGGYDYSDYDMLLKSVADGSLLGTIRNEEGFSPMPPGRQLDSCMIERISVWIDSLNVDSITPGDSIPDDDFVSTCDPDTVYFQNTILPLIVSSCATTDCHDAASHRDGIILTDYASIIKTGKIKPDDPDDSEFFETLTDDEDDIMPPSPLTPLDNDQIALIKKWILQGAKNNSCNDGCDTTNVTFAGTIWPMMQTYCTGCHSVSNPGGGILIGNYADLVALSQNGKLMGSINYAQGYAAMPTNQQLSDCNIKLIEKWIRDGYPEY